MALISATCLKIVLCIVCLFTVAQVAHAVPPLPSANTEDTHVPTAADFLEYLELLGYEFFDPPMVDRTLGYDRIVFSLSGDGEGMSEIHFLPGISDEVDPQNTMLFGYLNFGEKLRFCRDPNDTSFVSPYPTTEQKLRYFHRYTRITRYFNLVLFIDVCPQELDEKKVARLQYDFGRFSLELLGSLRSEEARLDQLKTILLTPIPDEYPQALKLLEGIDPEKLTNPRLIAAIEKLVGTLEQKTDAFADALKRARKARERELFEQSKTKPPALSPVLERVDTDGFIFRVSLANNSAETIVTSLYSGYLGRDAANVHFDYWPPGVFSPITFAPYFWHADVIPGDEPLLIPPGKSLSAVYDLSEIIADTDCTHVRARIAYRNSVTMTNFAKACRDTSPRPLPRVHHVPGSHEVYIERTVSSETEARLLAIAESALSDTGAISPWCSSFDGTKIPKAITPEVIRYYLDLTDDFRRGDFSKTNGIEMTQSTLEYTATVGKRTARTVALGNQFRAKPETVSTDTDVYVVEMTLKWDQYCGSVCAMTFSLTRTVVIHSSGRIIRILEDGCPPVEVS